jgi:hypothetical protein
VVETVVLDDAAGKIVAWTGSGNTLFSWGSREAPRKKFAELIAKSSHRPLLDACIEKCLSADREDWQRTIRTSQRVIKAGAPSMSTWCCRPFP